MDSDSPVKAAIIAIVALGALIASAAAIAFANGAGPGAVLSALLGGGSLLCALALWAAALIGAASVVAFYAASTEAREPDARKGFPRGLPAFLFFVSLGLFWLSLLCAAQLRAVPPDVGAPSAPLESTIVEPVEPPAPGPDPIDPGPVLAPETLPPPEVSARALPVSWIYAEPRNIDGDWRASAASRADLAALFPKSDSDGSARALLCGKAWVALAGAASQEGPRERNEQRARARAELAAEAALQWLEGQGPECLRPLVFGIDLGQHLETLDAASPDATAAQRQVLVAHRALAVSGEFPSAADARAEIEGFIADPAGRARLVGERRYARAPIVFFVADPR